MTLKANEAFDRQSQRTELLSVLARLPEDQRKALIAEYRARSEAAFAPETMRNYRMIIRLFTEWCQNRGLSAEPPIAPTTVAQWIDDMAGKLTCNTIETRLWGLAELHR